LLKLGVEIYSYNDHVRLLSPEPVGWIQHHQLYSSGGADIVMQSIALIEGVLRAMAFHEKAGRCQV
jgi:hypothetical protein